MTDKIISILKKEKIENYLINETERQSSELFFIRRKLDTRRSKSVKTYEVTVYRDFEKEGKKMRGSSLAYIFTSMTDVEIEEKLSSAYYAASFVCNPWFELAHKAEKEDIPENTNNPLATMPLSESASVMAEAIYQPDNADDAFINSAEIFSECVKRRTVGSNGTDVSYEKNTVKGEFVAQCIDGEDVEFHSQFEYDSLDTKQLALKSEAAIQAVRDRAKAKRGLKDGQYTVILDGEHVGTLMSYYISRANAGQIYAKYSDFEVGKTIQGEEIKGEKLDMKVCAMSPYSADGIRMKDRKFACDGKLMMIHGATRFCRYLGAEPAGTYNKIKVDCGSMSFEEMKKEPHLYVVKFSDFDMDEMSGHFGGEIRLAYYYDGKETHIVTGGSINGIITQVQTDYAFTKERYSDINYEGPFAVRIRNINVAGC